MIVTSLKCRIRKVSLHCLFVVTIAIIFPVTSLLVDVHGSELQLGTVKESTDGYQYHQIINPHMQVEKGSRTHTVTSHQVMK